jgi:Amiloride-sensitive sodium channel.
MGPVDFVASLGGLFGLCLGFSIISFLEIIYWLLAGIYKTILNK